jgi:hyaluronoglucosaminidase
MEGCKTFYFPHAFLFFQKRRRRKMLKKSFNCFTAVLLLVSCFLSPTITANAETSSTTTANTAQESGGYEIYPLPQKQAYSGTKFTITDEVNVVIEETIDEPTRAFLSKLFESKSLKVTFSEQTVTDKTNILLGTNTSNGYVDSYFKNNIAYDAAIFNKVDAYVLNIENGNIALLGADTDAAYYGLATLKMIFDQMPGKEIQSVKFDDYSDTKFRGFIEGFYGFPWSHEDRKSLMRFGGNFKMNTYIFAPKDDRYHNSAWRTPYPADELAKMKELVDVGHETKNQFVWAIHPGFNMINWNNYDAELQTLLAKLEQLYGIGVRQFGLFMDDISTSQSLTDRDKHVKLITDVANWAAAKGDVKPLIYCPPFYNQSWTGETGKPYLRALANVPKNVEIMWTGRSVVGSVNQTDMQWPKDLHGRDPYMWLNWPVNDYKDARLMLGKGEILKPGTHNISGVVSNPMGHAELNKIALFAVADFTWNIDDFNDEASWLDSFKYVAPEAAEELNTIAYHLSDPSPSGHGLVVGESENIKAELEAVLNKFTKGESVQDAGSQLIGEFDKILQAMTDFKKKSSNEKMKAEIEPWLNSLNEVVKSGKHAVQAAIALENNQMNDAWEGLASATSALSDSKNFRIKKLNYPDVTVEAGMKRLVPFAEQMIKMLDRQVSLSIDPDFISVMPMSSYGSSGWDRMVDGDPATYSYIQIIQKNGDWYGLDLGKTTKVHDIEIIQGRTDTDHDIFQRGVLEYSLDGTNWTPIGGERSGFKITEKELDVEARYVRYRLTHAGIPGGKPDLWTAVREFKVNQNAGKASIFSNVGAFKELPVTVSGNKVEMANAGNIVLKPGQYLGLELPAIENISDISVQKTAGDVTLESSENGVEWKTIALDGSYESAAYIRLINKGDRDANFELQQMSITLEKFSEPVVSHNYEGVYSGNVKNIFDGKLEDKTWFSGMQTSGKYVQVDMGGTVEVHNVAVVINDGEGDYLREGELQLSLDGKTWESIHRFTNPGDRSLNFPEHKVPYRYKTVQVDGQKARYVRLISTKTHNYWFALNEIIVNEGMARPGKENPSLSANPAGENGSEAEKAIDHKLATFYTPAGEPKEGSLTYKLSKHTQLSEIIILQDPGAISNATVSVRDERGWHKAGTLGYSYNSIYTARYKHVLEVKLEWDGTVKPRIYEILPVKRDPNQPRISIDSLDEELILAHNQGLITNKGILNSLLAKVDQIQKAAGDEKQTENGLNALKNEVQAQNGKHIDKDYAALLLEILAEYK